MIFIENKKAWKALVKTNEMMLYAVPDKFPCYQYYSCENDKSGISTVSCRYIYGDQVNSMLSKLAHGDSDTERVLEITKNNKKLDAPARTMRAGVHYEFIVGIGKDHVAFVTMTDGAYEELQRLDSGREF